MSEGIIFCSPAYLDKVVVYDLLDDVDVSPVWMQFCNIFIRDLLIFDVHSPNLFASFAPPLPPPSYESIAGVPPPPPASPNPWESPDLEMEPINIPLEVDVEIISDDNDDVFE